jgi:hypothetical protein
LQRKIFEPSQVRENGGNVWRIRVHKGKPPQQFWFLEFCFPLFLVDGFVTPPLRPAGQRLVCWVFERAIFFVDQGDTILIRSSLGIRKRPGTPAAQP